MRPSSSKRFPVLASRRSLLKASLLAGVGLGASACAKLPTSGPVRVADHDVRQADLVASHRWGRAVAYCGTS